MVTPTVRAEVYVGIDYSVAMLVLNDPIKGQLDDAANPLYDGIVPDIYADVAGDAFAYTVTRGRDSELDDISTGTLGLRVRNYAGTYFGVNNYTEPGKRVRLFLDEVQVYGGTVDDWQLSYEISGECTATMTAYDALGILAQSELDAWTTTAQTASVRLEAVLDRPEVAFPAAPRDTGSNGTGGDIGADTVASGTNALTYVKHVTYSDLGYVYASRQDILTFEPRQSLTYAVQAQFSDDGTAIPFSGIAPASSSRFLYNRVTVTRVGGVAQVADNAASQALYGLRTLDLADMLMNSDTDALGLADTLVYLYSTPRTRIESLIVNLGGLTPAQRATVLGLELGDFVTVTWTPQGIAQQVQSLRVEGIAVEGAADSVGVVSLRLSPAEFYPFPFILDNATEGVLDTSQIFY